jgi:hypothetical protein
MKKKIQGALAAIVIACPLLAQAAKPGPVPLQARVYGTVVDEQDTVGFFNDGGLTGCPDWATDPSTLYSALLPDGISQAIPAWSVPNWTATAAFTAGIYNNGSYCLPGSSACLRAEFNSSDKTLSLDTRTTAGPLRKFTLDLSDGYDLANDALIPGNAPVGQAVTTAGLFEVLGSSSLTAMGVCSSRACPEAREYPAKFWWVDGAGVTWRLDWRHMRVLHVSTDTWYFIANDCDGSQVAGLSKLEGSRTRPRETNQGYFLVPFFISVKR